MPLNKNKQVIVLGMHKSGTSITGKILEILNVKMGKELLKGDFSNPLGHFEDKKVIKLNEKLLNKVGGTWLNPPSSEELSKHSDEWKKEMFKYIQERNSNEEIWGVKDPRISLMLPIYNELLYNPYFIVCRRDGEEIAKSLEIRSGLNFNKMLELKKDYEKRIDDFFIEKNLNKLEIKYSDLQNAPITISKKIAAFLEIPISKENEIEINDSVFSKEELELIQKEKLMEEIKNWQMLLLKKPWRIFKKSTYKKMMKWKRQMKKFK